MCLNAAEMSKTKAKRVECGKYKTAKTTKRYLRKMCILEIILTRTNYQLKQ